MTATPPISTVSRYEDYLKMVYLRSKLPIKGKWPPSPCKKIIKMAAIERKGQRCQVAKFKGLESVDEYMQENNMRPVSIEELLKPEDGPAAKTVVVQGVPGIGKSTFAWKFCRKWAKGKIYQQYKLVILLHMRDNRVREAKKLSELFLAEDEDEEFSRNLAKDIYTSKGKETLFLLEGIDELPISCLADGTLLSNLLQGISLPEVTIVVTTRPWAVQMLTEKCGFQLPHIIEILGFTKEDIVRYTMYAFSEHKKEKTEFLEYFHSHPQLESIMHIPLNAAFVVQIFKQNKYSDKDIPHTLTQLYTSLVKGLLVRYMKSVPEFNELKLVDFENLPELIKTHFEQLCLLAFMSFTKVSVQVTFTDSEASLYGCLDSLGLMQSSADLSIDTGTTVTHSFLHFTIQEFLAAYHLSKQPAQVQEFFLETHKSDNQFHMLLRFLIGLNIDALQYIGEATANQEITTTHLHWLFESQSPLAISSYLGNKSAKYISWGETVSSGFDLYALSYCLCNSNCSWDLKIDLGNLSSLYSAKSNTGDGKIEYLLLISKAKSDLSLFFSLPKTLFSRTRTLLVFSDYDIDSTVAEILKSDLVPSLQNFYLESPHTVTDSLTALCSAFPDLMSIGFGGSVTSSDMLQLCQYITSPTRSDKSTTLELVLQSMQFADDSLSLLISAVACSIFLTHLCIRHSNISLGELEMLAVALSSNCTLKCLTLFNCCIDGEGAELLASGLEENKTLVEIDLWDNNINVNGAAALGSMLEENKSLKKLDLSNNILIGTEGALRLISALDRNKTLKTLILPSECEPVEYGSILLRPIQKENRVFFF